MDMNKLIIIYNNYWYEQYFLIFRTFYFISLFYEKNV